MDLTTRNRESLKLLDAEYRVETGHKVAQPVVTLFCRNEKQEYREIEVEGFRPYFMLSHEEFVDRTSDVINDRHVLAIEADLSAVEFDEDGNLQSGSTDDPESVATKLTSVANDTQVYHNSDTFDALDGTKLIKVFTIEPGHVGKIRDHFDRTWEADIPFTRRFLISSGIYLGLSVPSGADRVRYENWPGHSDSNTLVQEVEPDDAPDVDPRLLVVDIEVRTNGGGVPDPADANNAITAITAYDNYTGDYAGWILESDQWDRDYTDSEFRNDVESELGIDLETMRVFDHETQMVEDFHQWVLARNFDMASGWNSNGFDYPYIIQRSYNISAYSIRDWDMDDNPYAIGDEWPDPRIDGLVLFDMLDGYKKTQYRDLRSYSLDDVAEAELGLGKVQLEESLDDAWHKQPIEFMRYNVRDVEAVVEIEQSSALIDLYDNMRQVTGALYNTCNHNGPMLDTLFLRMAYDEGIALTTNEEPDQGDYHGAWVADPEPGVHQNVVYPDLASLYPFILWTLNISPETLYTCKENYRADGYDDSDVFTAYIDSREWYTMSSGDSMELSEIDSDTYKGVHDESGSRKKKTSQGFDGIFEPQFDEIYFLKPSVEEGFIRKTVDLLVDLKYKYKGQGDMYAATKRVTNCFTSDTEVVTPDGVRNIRELEVGDNVYSIDNDAQTVTTKEVTDVWSYPDYNDELVSIQNSHTDFKVTPNHEMLVNRHRRTDEWESTMAGDLNEYTSYQMPSNWDFDDNSRFGDTIDLKKFAEKHTDREVHVRTEDGSEYVSAIGGRSEIPRYIPVDDFIELLGWYTTEGSTYDTGRGNNYVMFTQNRGPDADRIEELVSDNLGNYWEEDAGSHHYKISSHLMADLFESLCGAGSENKKLPEFVFDMSSDRKELLFDTLIRGDGDTHSGVRYTTVSEKLKDDFTKLCVHVGRNPRVREEPESSTNYLVYRIRCSETDNSFRMNRDGGTDTADDGVYCVTVEDNHTLMAGRNGNFQFIKQSVYGVLGDSASGGKGFRLFDWKLAEAITLGGQKVINYTADQYIRLINEYSEDAGFDPESYLVGGDTDSVMTAIPQAPDYETALEWAQMASEEFQPDPDTGEPGLYDEFMAEEFDVVFGEDEHKMDVEIESLGSNLFFMQDGDNEDKAVKKRYAQHMIWDEDDGWLHDELPNRSTITLDDYESGLLSDCDPTDHIGIKGFEYVRSDSATVTKEAQLNVLTYVLLSDSTSDDIYEYLNGLRDDIYDDEYPIEYLGRPKGINNPLDDYGWKSVEELENDTNYTVTEKDEEQGGRYVSTPGPAYRGAKYADDHFAWEDIGEGSKPIRFYVEKVRGDEYPAAYEYESYPIEQSRGDSLEVGRTVDAIAVDNPERLPAEFVLDRDKMVNKELEDKIQPILRTIGEDWDGLIGDGRQVGLDQWT